MSSSTQFKKGQVPWNKGKKGAQKAWNKGLTRATDPRIIAPWEGKKRPNFPKTGPKPSMRGPNHPKWIADRSKLWKRHRPGFKGRLADPLYLKWMTEVKERDNKRCRIKNQDCNGRLEAHHILDWVNHPELRYEITNGITLCRFHHPKGRDEEKRWADALQKLVSASKV